MFTFNIHNHVDTQEILSLLNILKLQNSKIMATLAEIKAQVDTLQTRLDEEQAQIQQAIEGLNTTIQQLQQNLQDGGTVEERQEVLNKLTAITSDLQSTIPDTAEPVDPNQPAEG